MADINSQIEDLRAALRAKDETSLVRQKRDRTSDEWSPEDGSPDDGGVKQRNSGNEALANAELAKRAKQTQRARTRPLAVRVLLWGTPALAACLALFVAVSGGFTFSSSTDTAQGAATKLTRECMDMGSRYSDASTSSHTAPSLAAVIGAPIDANAAQIQGRCQTYVSAVQKMEAIAPREQHSFLCSGSRLHFDHIYAFVPLSDRSGVKLSSFVKDRNGTTQIDMRRYAISHGGTSMVGTWQFHNLGDGCLIVGHAALTEGGFKVAPDLRAAR